MGQQQPEQQEQKKDRNPLWVDLVFSMTPKRVHALWLVASSVVFSVYCAPWVRLFPNSDTVAMLFKITDWEWFLLMVPILVWYFAALWWMDKNHRWQ